MPGSELCVAQSKSEASPVAQSLRRIAQGMGSRIPEETRDKGWQVCSFKVRLQDLTSVVQIRGIETGLRAACHRHDVAFLSQHIGQGQGGAVLEHVSRSEDDCHHFLAHRLEGGSFTAPDPRAHPSSFVRSRPFKAMKEFAEVPIGPATHQIVDYHQPQFEVAGNTSKMA